MRLTELTPKDIALLPFYPVITCVRYLKMLSAAFGPYYVASIVLTYGVNQGIGEGLVYFARRYYLLNEVGLSSAAVGQLLGFAGIPWQLKSLFGVLSDTVPFNGLHRSPYMLFAGIIGVISISAITVIPPGFLPPAMYGVLLMVININFSMPDVMIDATVAERSRQRPDLAAELQALCWFQTLIERAHKSAAPRASADALFRTLSGQGRHQHSRPAGCYRKGLHAGMGRAQAPLWDVHHRGLCGDHSAVLRMD